MKQNPGNQFLFNQLSDKKMLKENHYDIHIKFQRNMAGAIKNG